VDFAAKIAQYIRKHGLIAPGDRVGVAVSGGADSVAMLRALLELRGELGWVLGVVHFNHKIRSEADSDAEFVEALAKEFGLEFFGGKGDAKKFATEQQMSLETAARELRYRFFSTLPFDKISTAHTLDDQAETVLMKLLRGAGTKGLSGIWPVKQYPVPSTQYSEKRVPRSARKDNQEPTQGPSLLAPLAVGAKALTYPKRSLRMTGMEDGSGTEVLAHEDVHAYTIDIVRPMLGVRRSQIEQYLRSLGQEWREDATNRDVKHTRNKVRHELLPLLEAEYNSNIYQQLADAAEVARGDEEFWAEVLSTQYSVPSTQERQSPRHDPSTSLGAASFARNNRNQYPVFSTQYPDNADPSTRAKGGRSLGMTSVTPSGSAKSRAHEDVRAHIDQNGAETGHAPSLREDVGLRLDVLAIQPLAVKRRVVRDAFEQVSGKTLDFEHTDALVRFLERRESSLLQLPERWFAVLDWPKRIITFEERVPLRKDGTPVGRKTSKKQRARSSP